MSLSLKCYQDAIGIAKSASGYTSCLVFLSEINGSCLVGEHPCGCDGWSLYEDNENKLIRTRVTINPEAGGGAVTYRDLSEGEQQLLLVLGLLKFTAEDEALFLLDEPDTHLNPAWSVEYLGFLDRFVKRRENCHIIMATHDPLLFASLLKEQVRIIRRDIDGSLTVEEPEEDPQGMGIEAILTSDLFRLRTTLDRPTQDLLDARRRLSMKNRPLNEEERTRLKEVNAKLRPLAFSKTTRDPLYQLFIEAWTEQEDPAWRDAMQLSDEQRSERELLARKIAVELQAETSDGNDGNQP